MKLASRQCELTYVQQGIKYAKMTAAVHNVSILCCILFAISNKLRKRAIMKLTMYVHDVMFYACH